MRIYEVEANVKCDLEMEFVNTWKIIFKIMATFQS